MLSIRKCAGILAAVFGLGVATVYAQTQSSQSSAVQFYDSTGAVPTSKFGWQGNATSGKFFIETPNDGNGFAIQNGNVTVDGAVTAKNFVGNGSGLTGIVAAGASATEVATTLKADAAFLTSVRGATGSAGPAGPAGPAGATGPAGPAGASPTAASVANTLKADTAFVSLTRGPAGPAGAPGAAGPAGATGPVGPQGPAGTAPTATAVATTLKADNAFLTSVRGATGPQGPAGATGPAGPTGPVGPQGPAGAGLTGSPVYSNVVLCRSGVACQETGYNMDINTNQFGLNSIVQTNSNSPSHTRAATFTNGSDAMAVLGYRPSSSVAWAGFFNGSVYLSGTCDGCQRNTSDEKTKKNIENINSPSEKIKSIRGVKFKYNGITNNSESQQFGVIAQDIQKVLPEAVSKQSNGYLAVDYNAMIALLIETVKEQQSTIELQQKEIQEIKSILSK